MFPAIPYCIDLLGGAYLEGNPDKARPRPRPRPPAPQRRLRARRHWAGSRRGGGGGAGGGVPPSGQEVLEIVTRCKPERDNSYKVQARKRRLMVQGADGADATYGHAAPLG